MVSRPPLGCAALAEGLFFVKKPGRARRTQLLEALFVVCLLAASLVDATAASARTIRVPETLMRSVTFDGARGRVSLASRPTHIAFTWDGSHDSGVSYRTIDDAGRATRWRVAPMAHDMETGNTRFTGLVEVDRPAHVEYRKDVKTNRKAGDEWMGPVTMESINTLDGPKREVALASTGQSGPGDPPIVTRAEWGADETLKRSTGGCQRTFHPLQQIFVHHTAGSNNDYNGAATMRAIYAYHTQSRGWCDLGYNFVIDWSGRIFEGRWARTYASWETHDSEDSKGNVVAGAHVGGFNSGSVGISLMGNFTSVGPPVAMKQSLKAMLAWEAGRHGLDPMGTHSFNGRKMRVIAGHRDAGQTACPGKRVYDLLPNFRRKTKAMIDDGPTVSRLSLAASSPVVKFGQSVGASGALADASGQPLADQPVTLFRKYRGAEWKVHSTATTGPNGEFSAMLEPRRRIAVSASFATNTSHWGSDSRVVRVNVKHSVTMAPSDREPDTAGVYHYGASEKRVVLGGRVRPAHAGGIVRVRLFQRAARGSYVEIAEKWPELDGSGSFVQSFPLTNRKPGTRYRVAAKMPEDGAHESGYSGSKFLVVD